jgi:hypothetical protein
MYGHIASMQAVAARCHFAWQGFREVRLYDLST